MGKYISLLKIPYQTLDQYQSLTVLKLKFKLASTTCSAGSIPP